MQQCRGRRPSPFPRPVSPPCPRRRIACYARSSGRPVCAAPPRYDARKFRPSALRAGFCVLVDNSRARLSPIADDLRDGFGQFRPVRRGIGRPARSPASLRVDADGAENTAETARPPPSPCRTRSPCVEIVTIRPTPAPCARATTSSTSGTEIRKVEMAMAVDKHRHRHVWAASGST